LRRKVTKKYGKAKSGKQEIALTKGKRLSPNESRQPPELAFEKN
jgi:hypothetical protein